MQFRIHATDGEARQGELTLAHGTVRTPAFMPVGTYGTVKAMTPRELEEEGADIVLGNTFHLWLRPGLDVIGNMAGIVGWNADPPDSGGFRVSASGPAQDLGGRASSRPQWGRVVFSRPRIDAHPDLDSDIAWCSTVRSCAGRGSQHSMQLSVRWGRRGAPRAAPAFRHVQEDVRGLRDNRQALAAIG